ncbi:hypothetical protein [Chryseobacterium sp. LAM-KRS1]|uniref:hypothetical protein n=1 Tax=Chryseobacterium sp. LAM-KRS1 TaxID=2715754 RepID=UPI001554B692|nr:hypothetical protein [Chryseobacterium sp. LAM-KRS1]
MKNIIILLLSITTTIIGSCHSQKSTENKHVIKNNQKNDLEKIELTEQTRGTDRKITFTSDSIVTYLNGESKITKSNDTQWTSIVKQTSSLNLDKLPSYTAPTTGRFSDSALSSVIIVTYKGKIYQSSGFDAGAPPKELEALYLLLKK